MYRDIKRYRISEPKNPDVSMGIALVFGGEMSC